MHVPCLSEPTVEDPTPMRVVGETMREYLARSTWANARELTGRGVMARESDPPWAGVLAFPRLHIAGASEPALFRAPAYVADLPNAIGRLETWTVEDGTVQVAPPQDPEAWAGMEWARDVANST
jgi:hypothetical protein